MGRMKIGITLGWTLFLGFASQSHANEALCRHLTHELEQARGFYERGQMLLGATKASSLFHSRCDDRARADAKRIAALALSELGEKDEAERVLRDLDKTETGETLRKLRFIRAYVLDLESDLLGESDRARLRLWRLRGDRPAFSREFSAWMSKGEDRGEIDRLHRLYAEARPKSPALAGTLSALIPGAGQAYNGAWQSAALAFALNALFLWSTVEFIDRDLVGPAVASGAVFSVTYFGNIFSAIEGAQTVNRLARTPHEAALKRELLPELSVRIPF